MAFKACITVLAAMYDSQELGEMSYEDWCPYETLNTGENSSLVLNCTTPCGLVLNDTMPCVNATDPPLNFASHQNYTCTVGSCHNGTCPSNNSVQVACWANAVESEGEELLERAYSVQLY
ncbi:evasin P467-like [Rhipicephalus sanguineus]|uniref:evasin P467-like n=1 Tax=Rhipicephalus sanguineus TaxID=34632 RepID=UPI0018962739|nr:evasin P467-like [Rhipicephalus sanguineus]